jgi:hypothetical protein
MGSAFDRPERLPPPECAAALEVLHRWLDGEAVGIPPEVAGHTALCMECGGRFAASGQLSIALVKVRVPPAPVGLADRIVAEALADFPRQRRARQMWRLSYAGLAVAAALLLAIWLTQPAATQVAPIQGKEMVHNDGPPAPDLRRDLREAGTVVASLTRRAADEVAGAGRQLLPPPEPAPPPPEPVRTLDEAGTALADGFEPVAASARRAARLVLREFSMEDDKK